MKRYFFHIGYNGFNYHGWQRQPKHLAIQEVLEENLRKALKEPVAISGCGRTDAQVHASQYFFHLDTKQNWDFDLVFRLNKMLPPDIAVFEIIPVSENSHAQFAAKQRTYDYFIHTYKDPFLSNLSSYYSEKGLDSDKMKEALSLLVQYNDYRAFCKSPDQYKHTLCNISSAKLFSGRRGENIRIQISSNRFLHGMIRAIVAKLIKIGNGQMSIEEFENLLAKKEAQKDLEFAYPQGLYLSKVVYPFLDIPPRAKFVSAFQPEEEWMPV
jgi:tRNA pseudouridine38-40 synthase